MEQTAVLQEQHKEQRAGQREAAEKTKTQPAKKIRAGAVCATIWENTQSKDGREFKVSSIQLVRNYTDKSGAWQTSNYLRAGDLPKAALVLSKAYEYLTLHELGNGVRPNQPLAVSQGF